MAPQLPTIFESSRENAFSSQSSSSSPARRSSSLIPVVGRCFRACPKDKKSFAVAAVALALFVTGVVLVATSTLPGLGWTLIVGSPIIGKLVMNKLKQPNVFEAMGNQTYFDHEHTDPAK